MAKQKSKKGKKKKDSSKSKEKKSKRKSKKSGKSEKKSNSKNKKSSGKNSSGKKNKSEKSNGKKKSSKKKGSKSEESSKGKKSKSKSKYKESEKKKKGKKSKSKSKNKPKESKSKSKKKDKESDSGEDGGDKKKKLKEKAKQLASKIEGEEEVKEKLKKRQEESKEGFLIPIKDYLKTGAYIGTKVITPHMRKFIYKRRNDGIANIDTNMIDKKLREAAKELAEYDPEDFIVVCKRESGWYAVEKFGQIIGARVFTQKYPAGILTNPKLPNFFETDMVFVCDPWVDKNAMNDAKRVKSDVFALCDTNNYTFKVDQVIPVNNKAEQAIGLAFYLLAREYKKERGEEVDFQKEDFMKEKSKE